MNGKPWQESPNILNYLNQISSDNYDFIMIATQEKGHGKLGGPKPIGFTPFKAESLSTANGNVKLYLFIADRLGVENKDVTPWFHRVARVNTAKSVQGLEVNIGAAKYCFASVHIRPGKNLADRLRKTEFTAYTRFLDGKGCDTVLLGGDFNFHSDNGWKLKENQEHPHFRNRAKLDYMRRVRQHLPLFMTGIEFLEAYPSPVLPMRPEVLVRNDEFIGNHGIFNDENFDEWEVADSKKITLKRIVPTFAPSRPELMRYKQNRPVGVADYIFHKMYNNGKVECKRYGVVVGPMRSDHYPVHGIYEIKSKHPIVRKVKGAWVQV
jgi:hypothetical protein